jgi:hypothetical protein
MQAHTNENFNIIQTGSGFKKNCWSVFQGKRLPSGHPATGSLEIKDKLTREQAIKLADSLEANQ